MTMDATDRLEIVPFDGPVDAVVRPPGSKSITNRALLVAALARGRSTITGLLHADDTDAMLGCIRGLGAAVALDGTTAVIDGLDGTIPAARPRLDARESGTTARFVAATLLLSSSPVTLDADEAMRRRPMAAIVGALRGLGATVATTSSDGSLPCTVTGPTAVPDATPTISLAADVSSQFLSGLLIVGACLPLGLRLVAEGDIVSRPYLDMTVAVMERFGAVVDRPDDRTWVVAPGGYRAADLEVEPDASGASYFFALAAVTGGRITVEGLGRHSIQGDLAFVDVLERMGAAVDRSEDATTVTGGALHGVEVDMSDISDTAQTAAAVAAFADSPTRVTGIGFIRAKETDRIGATVAELRRLGVDAVEEPDGFVIGPAALHGAECDTHDDHRMAMSLSIVGARVPGVVLRDPGCVAKTFPTYFELFESVRPGGSE